jgi:hypothetical protein
MSRREKLSVGDAIALRAFDGGPHQTPRAFAQHGDGVRLLQEITDIFCERKADRLRTSVIIESLSTIQGSLWSGEYSRDAQKLALLLRPLLIRPKTIRFKDGFYKGYLRRWFEETLVRLAEVPAAGGRRS